jgi:glutamate synthase domain-containing protein 2
MIVLSDRCVGPDRLPLPSLLVVGAVHQRLLRAQLRSRVALFADCGDAREVHDFAALLGFGADAVCPYFAYEAIAHMNETGTVSARSHVFFTDEELFEKYRGAAAKGILKVMSKMGISTLQSYKGAQVFEALGLADEIMQRCFTGTASRIQGVGFAGLLRDMQARHAQGYSATRSRTPGLSNPGQYHLRHGGETHLNTPENMVALQQASLHNSVEHYREYVRLTDEQNRGATLRGLLRFKSHGAGIPVEEVESAAEIVKRFNTGAMSLGSISQETHEALAVAMNRIGARSNTGEGGEDPRRFQDSRRSAIKQIASGRFGVTSHYLANADQLQIKIAQGAKPGEGGELPGDKVTAYIAENRATTPGVGLISPPPHHDIYSIEDLAQLIFDLKVRDWTAVFVCSAPLIVRLNCLVFTLTERKPGGRGVRQAG